MLKNKHEFKTKVRRYTEDDLKKALESVRAGNSVGSVAAMYNIPRATLFFKAQGKFAPTFQRPGPQSVLGDQDEARLMHWIFHMSDRGFPVTRDQLLDSVYLLLKSMKKKTIFNNNRPGRHWYDSFHARHPDLAVQMSQNLSYSRTLVTEKKLRGWFDHVGAYLKSKNLEDISASRIFNCGELAFFLAPKSRTVLLRRMDKTAHNFINDDEKECLTTLFCGNAAGQLLQPIVTFNFVRTSHNILVNMPNGWGIGGSESGWITGELFYGYIGNVFHPWLVSNNIELPVVMFLDANFSPMTLALNDLCREKGIELIALPPNATHILQPVDVSLYNAFKLTWFDTVCDWKRDNKTDRLNRNQFGPVLKTALEKIHLENILRHGFQTSGLHPFSASAIDYQKFFDNSSSVPSSPATSTIFITPTTSSTTPATPANQMPESSIFLKFVEDNIATDILEVFKIHKDDDQWTGEIQHRSLFHFWKSARSSIHGCQDSQKEVPHQMTVVKSEEVAIKVEPPIHDETEPSNLALEDEFNADQETFQETKICDELIIKDSEDSMTYEINPAGELIPVQERRAIYANTSELTEQKTPTDIITTYNSMTYKKFVQWQKLKNTTSFSENVLMAYFNELSVNHKSSSSLWTIYSMLKSTIITNQNIDIKTYSKLFAFLKKQAVGFKSRESNVFTPDEVEKFLNEAPNEKHLITKVALIFGILGACRTAELIKITVHNIKEYESSRFLVTLSLPKTRGPRTFTVNNKLYEIVKKYQSLRPPYARSDRFFLNYQNAKPIGMNTFRTMPKVIAAYLKLPDPDSYTGRSFRRTSATFLAGAGADIRTLKRYGGWKSNAIAGGYIKRSLNNKINKMKICEQIGDSMNIIEQEDIETPSVGKRNQYSTSNITEEPPKKLLKSYRTAYDLCASKSQNVSSAITAERN